MSVDLNTFSRTMDAATLRKIRAVALGQSTELPRMRMIARLPLLDTEAREDLITIAADARIPPRLRRVAVGSLGKLRDRPLDLIERYALDPDMGVAAAAIKVLGRVGNVGSLTVLGRVAGQRRDPILRQRAAFASALIAHRFSLPGYELPSVTSAAYLDLPRRTLSVQTRPATPSELASVKSTLAHHSLDLPMALVTWDLHVGKKRWALALDESLLSPWKPNELATKKHYLGQLSPRNHVTGAYSPGLAFLATGQGGGHLEVAMYRASGQLIFGGEGNIDGDVLHFSMRATDRPGASATVIGGSFSQAGLVLTVTTSATRSRPAFSPVPTKTG